MDLFDTFFGELLMTFLIAMVPVLELRGAIPAGIAAGLPPAAAAAAAILGAPGRHSCGSGGGTLPGRGLPGVHPGQYGAGALYPAADPPDLRLAPGHPPFRPQDRLAGAPGTPQGPNREKVSHHRPDHPRGNPAAGDRGLDRRPGGRCAGPPAPDSPPRHRAWRPHRRNHYHHRDLRRHSSLLVSFAVRV